MPSTEFSRCLSDAAQRISVGAGTPEDKILLDGSVAEAMNGQEILMCQQALCIALCVRRNQSDLLSAPAFEPSEIPFCMSRLSDDFEFLAQSEALTPEA